MTGRAARRFPRRLAPALVLLVCACAALPAAASAQVKWAIKTEWGPTTVPPGGKGQLLLQVMNFGDTASAGQFTVTNALPPKTIATGFAPTEGISCFGTTTVTCQAVAPVEPLDDGFGNSAAPLVFINFTASPSASGIQANTATVSGGGAAHPATDVDQISFASTADSFGSVEGSLAADVFDAAFPGGAAERQAGTHPYEMRVGFDFKLKHATNPATTIPYTEPIGRVRTAEVTLPRGLIGNPEAVQKCKPLEFLSEAVSLLEATGCPPETQVGYLRVKLFNGPGSGGVDRFGRGGEFTRVAIYNLEPPHGVPVDLGFQIGTFAVGHIYAALDPANGYAIKSFTPYITNIEGIRGVQATFWGVPGDEGHRLLRANPAKFLPGGQPDGSIPPFGASIAPPYRPFFTMPSSCDAENGPFRASFDSWNDPGAFTPAEESASPLEVEGCDDQRIRFKPQVSLNPTSRAAGGPTGLDVNLEVPQREQTVEDYANLYADSGDLHAIDTPPMKRAVVTFPEGMTLSTSAAQGLTGCTPEQIGLGNNDPVRCPDSSQYGTLTLHTPILPADEPMHGFIYIAQQDKNPFGTFLALYLVIEDPSRGLRVKIPGRLDLDEKTGQITSTFDDLPQFPVSDMRLSFKSGVRAGLVNPATCGPKQITATFYSWHDPATPITKSSSYQVTHKPDGSPCINHLAERQFRPGFEAGTVNPNAGSYSPFVFRMTRGDEDQEFSQLSTTLPPGLLANISKLEECPEAGIAQAEAPGRTGTAEKLLPSCPAASQLGTTDVGSGVGQVITYIPGKAYLAGPYRGEPLSMVVITPILAGPYDLGVIAVRSAIHVDGERGQATIATDPFPQIYRGIPVRLRDVRVKADTPETIVNPTSCEEMAVTARVTGTGGDPGSTADDTAADLASRFQAANCASLPFKPSLKFALKGKTRRGGFPSFRANLRGRAGDANIARSTVVLPDSLFIEQGHIRTVCTRVQYATDQCPRGSIYGYAKARSPLFDEVLGGPVYLRSNGGERLLPDLVVKLNGRISVSLVGFIDSLKDGRVRNTFDVVPDAPVTYFSLRMQGGRKGLLVNHRNLCASPSRAVVRLVGQNGKRASSKPVVGTSCKKRKKTDTNARQGGRDR